MTKATPAISRSACAGCGKRACYRRDGDFPTASCPTASIPTAEVQNSLRSYRGRGIDARLARAAAEVEGATYGRLTRVEETIAFAKALGARRIGLAVCVGLLDEARILSRVLIAKGLEPVAVVCKVGGIDKSVIGIPDTLKVGRGGHESLCNPVLQARFLNRARTQLNLIVGLCVGHDALFARHARAPVSTLIAKDRVLGHNPVAALHGCGFYFKRLLEPEG